MSDLSEIQPVSRTIEILHPGNGRPIGVRVSLMSLDDERLSKIRRAITDKRLHLEARAKTFKAEEIEANRMAILTTAITGWEWYSPTGEKEDCAKFKGEVPDFNRTNVKEVLTDLSWFGDQINEALGETESFFEA